jgi:integrase
VSGRKGLTLAIIRRLCNWFASRDSDYISPVVKGMGRYPAADRKRDRILNDDELRALWKACTDAGTFGALLEVLLLTGQRRDKVLTMRWDNITEGVWTIPTERREKGNAGSLRLPAAVLEIIETQPRIAGNPFVFAGRGGKAFNNFTERTNELHAKLGDMPHWTPHDLRRTARSLMSRAEVRPDIAERVLGHVRPGVEAIYDRHHYDAEKADALARLAALVATIVNPPEGNVVPAEQTEAGTARRPHPMNPDVRIQSFTDS